MAAACAAGILPARAEPAQEPQPEHLGDAWSDPRNPITRIFKGERLDLWSFKPIRHPAPPPADSTGWARTPVDLFLLAAAPAGSRPRPEADKRALARRVYYDLTGLPPSPEALGEFLLDNRPDAYERLVDRLLDSPARGEHMARGWMDVIRYSDSNGFDWDEFRPQAWRFRDYLVRSFNQDKPLDRLIAEHLAGDELVGGPPETPAEQDAWIATGYLRLGPHDNSAPLFNEQARSRAELMTDLVETTASAFLGMTLACSRCHDHKFDPVSQADHFRMRAFFEGVKFADDLPLDLASEQAEINRHNAALEERLKPLEARRDSLLHATRAQLRAERLASLDPAERDLLDLADGQAAPELQKEIDAIREKLKIGDKEVRKALPESAAAEDKSLAAEVDDLKKRMRGFTHGLLMTDKEGDIPTTHVLYQGDHKQPRDPVPAGFLSALDPNPAAVTPPPGGKTSGRRLALARWLASPANPLTPRVMANRIWQSLYGKGLVETSSDFGLAGSHPTHPELLDWLATQLVEGGWSLKRFQRLLVTSAAYRQAALGQPGIPGWPDGRQGLRRLTAEQLRDSLLAVSGLLNQAPGGPPVWPELPSEVLVANPAFLDDNETRTKGWYPSPAADQSKRSLYLVQKRTVRVPFMETFDLPENSTSCALRQNSIVAPQALSLLNSPLMAEAANAFASRVEKEAGPSAGDRVRRAFHLALQRPPDATELRACLRFLEARQLPELCRVLLNSNEFIYID